MAVPEIRLMRAAIGLAEELSFSRAAQRLHLTQPAITKQIAELEDELGFVLFQRDHQVVVVTDAGRAFVEEAVSRCSTVNAPCKRREQRCRTLRQL